MNLELLKHAQGYIENMAKGIHPLTGEIISDNEILNNIRISRCLFYVNDVLKDILTNAHKNISKNKIKLIPFSLTTKELSQYEYTSSLTISRITQKLNQLRSSEGMEKLKVSQLSAWLVDLDLLQVVEEKGHKLKRPTAIGENMGTYVEHVINHFREYDAVFYNLEMQKYIITHFNDFLNFIHQTEKV